jgi:hypothetical protein
VDEAVVNFFRTLSHGFGILCSALANRFAGPLRQNLTVLGEGHPASCKSFQTEFFAILNEESAQIKLNVIPVDLAMMTNLIFGGQ